MQLGRLDEATTANVGTISGGTATNVVPGECSIEAEARSLDAARASEAIAAMTDACTWAAGRHDCDLAIDVFEMFRGYRVPRDAESIAVARAALGRRGIEAREVATGGGSDANALMAAGFEALLLANGTDANHTPQESVAAGRIVEMLAVCVAIAEEAAARNGSGDGAQSQGG
jgi:tripeptide aminopeptidase